MNALSKIFSKPWSRLYKRLVLLFYKIQHLFPKKYFEMHEVTTIIETKKAFFVESNHGIKTWLPKNRITKIRENKEKMKIILPQTIYKECFL